MPHLLYLAIGFPPAAKSCSYRMLATANLFREHGWEVTVLTIGRAAWLREYGLDDTLAAHVDPGVSVVELPLARRDLEPDIRGHSWFQARYPNRWRRYRHTLDRMHFPEPVFGSWRWTLQAGAERVHRAKPVDLVLVSPAPYTMLAAAWQMHVRYGLPYAIDYRDAWSLDVIGGKEAFPPFSRAGAWERRMIDCARTVWCVNEPIRDFYADRYPNSVSALRVVRNGFDPAGVATRAARRDPDGLTFGYLGTVNFPVTQMKALLTAWRAARQRETLLARSRLEFRGHLGAGAAKAANAHAQLIAAHAADEVSYGGPVARAEVADVYAGWDALVLALTGGRYVTSGKVYEYLSTGLPIVSVHAPEHAAADVLRGHPLWVATASLEPTDIETAFLETARLARSVDEADRSATAAHAARFHRRTQLEPVVRELSEQFPPAVSRSGTGVSETHPPGATPVTSGPAGHDTAGHDTAGNDTAGNDRASSESQVKLAAR